MGSTVTLQFLGHSPNHYHLHHHHHHHRQLLNLHDAKPPRYLRRRLSSLRQLQQHTIQPQPQQQQQPQSFSSDPLPYILGTLFILILCFGSRPRIPSPIVRRQPVTEEGESGRGRRLTVNPLDRQRAVQRALIVKRIVQMDGPGVFRLGSIPRVVVGTTTPTSTTSTNTNATGSTSCTNTTPTTSGTTGRYGKDDHDDDDVYDDPKNKENACDDGGMEEESTTCVICLEPFRIGDRVAWTKQSTAGQKEAINPAPTFCQHVFHEECIRSWLLHSNHDDCPACRQVILHATDCDEQQRHQNGIINDIHDASNNDDDHEHWMGSTSMMFVIINGLVSSVRRASCSLMGHAQQQQSSQNPLECNGNGTSGGIKNGVDKPAPPTGTTSKPAHG